MSEDIAKRQGRPMFKRARSAYKACALMFFNFVVFYVLINIVLAGAIAARDLLTKGWSSDDVVTIKYGSEVLDKVYPDMKPDERDLMLSEHYQPFIYSDFNHFRERPLAGKYVHVEQAGFRKSLNQGPWPPAATNYNIFVFGGSTTFGCGLPDDQSLPSNLQQALAERADKRVCIYNFGVGYYYSTQERLCLEKLLMDGFVPNAAFFIDGINEGTHLENRPTSYQQMSELFEQSLGEEQLPSSQTSLLRPIADALFFRLPIGRGARALARAFKPQDVNHPSEQNWESDKSPLRVCETYFTNKYLIERLCQRFGVAPVFVWQPSPAYNYDLTYHLFAPPKSLPAAMLFHYAIMRDYYPKMNELAKQRDEANFIWCADIQKDRTDPLYCDRYHYTAVFAKELASHICQVCLDRKLLDGFPLAN